MGNILVIARVTDRRQVKKGDRLSLFVRRKIKKGKQTLLDCHQSITTFKFGMTKIFFRCELVAIIKQLHWIIIHCKRVIGPYFPFFYSATCKISYWNIIIYGLRGTSIYVKFIKAYKVINKSLMIIGRLSKSKKSEL